MPSRPLPSSTSSTSTGAKRAAARCARRRQRRQRWCGARPASAGGGRPRRRRTSPRPCRGRRGPRPVDGSLWGARSSRRCRRAGGGRGDPRREPQRRVGQHRRERYHRPAVFDDPVDRPAAQRPVLTPVRLTQPARQLGVEVGDAREGAARQEACLQVAVGSARQDPWPRGHQACRTPLPCRAPLGTGRTLRSAWTAHRGERQGPPRCHRPKPSGRGAPVERPMGSDRVVVAPEAVELGLDLATVRARRCLASHFLRVWWKRSTLPQVWGW